MISYILIISIFLLILSFKYPELVFWIGIFGVLDIGQFIEFFSTQQFGRDVLQYIFLFFIFVPLLSPKLNLKFVRKNREIIRLLKILIFFLVYHVLIYGFIKPYTSVSEFLYFFTKHSPEIIGTLAIVPAYLVIKRNPKTFYYLFAFLGLFYLVAYFITVFSNYELMPIKFAEKSHGLSIARRILPNFVFIQSIISLAFIQIITKLKLRYKNLYLLIAFMMVIAVMMSMSRLRILIMILELFVVGAIYVKIYKLKLPVYTRLILIGSTIFIVVIATVPVYYNSVIEMYTNIYSELISGDIARGTYQNRTEFEIPMQLSIFNKNKFFGTGYDEKWYSGGINAYNASDTPYLAGIAMFGIFGILLYLFFYLKIYFSIKKGYKFLKKYYFKLINRGHNEELVLFFFSISVLFIMLLNVADYFKEFVRGERGVYLGLILGMILGTKENIKKILTHPTYKNQNFTIPDNGILSIKKQS